MLKYYYIDDISKFILTPLLQSYFVNISHENNRLAFRDSE